MISGRLEIMIVKIGKNRLTLLNYLKRTFLADTVFLYLHHYQILNFVNFRQTSLKNSIHPYFYSVSISIG